MPLHVSFGNIYGNRRISRVHWGICAHPSLIPWQCWCESHEKQHGMHHHQRTIYGCTCRCEPCVNVVFSRPTAPCPVCGLTLRKNLFRPQQFEDPRVEIDVDVRRKILKEWACQSYEVLSRDCHVISSYNKTEEDFATLREFNDYLEEVETISKSLWPVSLCQCYLLHSCHRNHMNSATIQ